MSVGIVSSVLFSLLVLFMRRRRDDDAVGDLPPISVLKPFDGVDPGLEGNFWSYLSAPYPAKREVLFCTARDNDEGIAVVERLLARLEQEPQPGVTARLLLPEPDEEPWVTRKVWHMARGFAAARHDVIVNGDSGTRLEAETLVALVRTLLADPQRGGAWASYTVEGGDSLGVRLTRAAWTATTNSFFVIDALHRVIGKPPLLAGGLFAARRAAVEQLDGFAALDGLLTEDLDVGRRMHAVGWAVEVSPVPVVRYLPELSWSGFVARQQRWNVILWRFREPLRWPYPLTMCGLAIAPVTAVFASLAFPERTGEYVTALGALYVARALYALVLTGLAGRRLRLDVLALLPILDAVFLVTWLRGPFIRHIAWRDTRLRVGRAGRVTRIEERSAA